MLSDNTMSAALLVFKNKTTSSMVCPAIYVEILNKSVINELVVIVLKKTTTAFNKKNIRSSA